jgi:DNA-binding transcriptional ArsR family regulator
VPRPKNASYKSYRRIYDALYDGPRYFEDLRKATRLHRNTLATRLKFLVKEGLVSKRRAKNRTFYEISKQNVWRWLRYTWKPNPKEISQAKAQIKEFAKNELKRREIFLEELIKPVQDFHSKLDKLAKLPESQEILEIIPQRSEMPICKLWGILVLNKFLVECNLERLVCPNCYSFDVAEEGYENVCRKCGFVIGDEIIPAEKRLEIILDHLRT